MKHPKQTEQDGAQRPGGQDGQSLVVILLLGAVLAFFGAFLTRMIIQEAKQTVATKNRDKAFTAGDAALQQSMNVLLESTTNWDNADAISGYNSLTGTAYSGIPGLTYNIKILKGTLEDSNNVGASTDAAVLQWVNVGDSSRDRTIFVRTVDNVTGHEDRFFTVVHKTAAPPYLYGGDAIYAEGDITLGNNWQGHVYNSCLGPYGGSGALPNSEGSITLGGAVESGQESKFDSGGNWDGYNYSPGSTASPQPLVVPAGTIAIPGYAKTSAISANITLSNPTDGSTIMYECYSLNLTSKTLTVNGPGKIQLWITAPTGGKRFILGGSGDVVVNANSSSECCKSKLFTVYMTADDPTNSDVSIEWHGCPTGNFLLVAPKANMDFRGGGSNNFFGALVVKNLIIAPNSNADFYYDACLKTRPPVDNYALPPLITTHWQQVGIKGASFP